MLARYQIRRGRPISELPERVRHGRRMDTRKHTRHVLRPETAMVEEYLSDPGDDAWRDFATSYERMLERRAMDDPAAFDELRDLALREDVFLGCSCPTARNPDVMRCHTVLALRFMQARYPELDVRLPGVETNDIAD